MDGTVATEPPRPPSTRPRRLILALALMAATVGCDRITKDIAEDRLKGESRHSFLGDTVRLEYVENRGAFLGLGRNLSRPVRFWVFTVGTGILVALLAFRLVLGPDGRLLDVIAGALLCGGGLANLIDRAVRDGAVVDFLNVGVGPLRTGIFNIADMAITGAVCVLLLGHRTRRAAS
jgi:signal peptidase II